MIVVELALVVLCVWAVAHVAFRLLGRPLAGVPVPSTTARWRITHYDADGETRVVLERQDVHGDRGRGRQHVVGTIPLDDPDYEATFLALMDAARQRRAIFEAEEDR